MRLGPTMRAALAVLLIGVAMLVWAAPAFAGEATLPCAEDTFITNAGPDTNYDAAGYTGLGTYRADAYRTLLKFDLADVPGTITGVKLRVYYYDGAGFPTGQVEVFGVERAWTEDLVTWNQASPGEAWSVPGATGAGDISATPLGTATGPVGYPSWFEIELDPARIDALRGDTDANQGFLLKGDWDAVQGFETHLYRGRTDVNAPQLVVTYDEQDAGGPRDGHTCGRRDGEKHRHAANRHRDGGPKRHDPHRRSR